MTVAWIAVADRLPEDDPKWTLSGSPDLTAF